VYSKINNLQKEVSKKDKMLQKLMEGGGLASPRTEKSLEHSPSGKHLVTKALHSHLPFMKQGDKISDYGVGYAYLLSGQVQTQDKEYTSRLASPTNRGGSGEATADMSP